MLDADRKLISTFEARLKHLLFICQQQQQRIESLENTIREKEMAIEKANHLYRELSTQYNNLKTAKIVSVGDNDLRNTQKRLSKLVREVNKCIALLND